MLETQTWMHFVSILCDRPILSSTNCNVGEEEKVLLQKGEKFDMCVYSS